MKRTVIIFLKGLVGLVAATAVGIAFLYAAAFSFHSLSGAIALYPFVIAFALTGFVATIIFEMDPAPPTPQNPRTSRYTYKVLAASVVLFIVLLAWLVYASKHY